VSKVMFGEQSNTSFEQTKQQLGETIRCLTELKDSFRPSTDRYNEVIGSLDGITRSLIILKRRFSRKQGGVPNRNSCTLPPPGLKVDIESEPFSITIPGIEESQKESTLEAVQESKEKEV